MDTDHRDVGGAGPRCGSPGSSLPGRRAPRGSQEDTCVPAGPPRAPPSPRLTLLKGWWVGGLHLSPMWQPLSPELHQRFGLPREGQSLPRSSLRAASSPSSRAPQLHTQPGPIGHQQARAAAALCLPTVPPIPGIQRFRSQKKPGSWSPSPLLPVPASPQPQPGAPSSSCACPTSSCLGPGLLIRPPSQTVPCQVPGGFLKRKSHHVASDTLTIYIPPKDKLQISWQGPEVSGVWVLPISPATFHNAPLTHSCGGFAASPFGSLCSALTLPCPPLT